MQQALPRQEKELIKEQVRALAQPRQQALHAVLDKYVEGDDLSHIQCSPHLGTIFIGLNDENILHTELIAKRGDIWDVEISVQISDEFVGELWQVLYDMLPSP